MASTGIAAAAGLALPALTSVALSHSEKPQRQRPIFCPLKLQPVISRDIYQRKLPTSWRVTGAIQKEQELPDEEQRISRDLATMASSADFPLEIPRPVTVRNIEQAVAVAKKSHDVLIIYAVPRDRPVLEALASPDKWNLMFLRPRSGPL